MFGGLRTLHGFLLCFLVFSSSWLTFLDLTGTVFSQLDVPVTEGERESLCVSVTVILFFVSVRYLGGHLTWREKEMESTRWGGDKINDIQGCFICFPRRS